jgi:pimeloyl-ACP methyl ester carboxylesterase
MTTFVLVHGAWHGGWSWQLVSQQLEAAGHRAITPTLTGLGERAHLISPQVNLATHVEDVAAVLRYEDLRDVVLVGHSYAGLVITGAGAREFDRVAQLIYYDAFLPDDGQSALDLLPPHVARHFTESAEQHGAGWLMPRRPLEALGVRSPTAKAWLEPRLVPHPLATYSDKLWFDLRVRQLPSSYISCTDWAAVFAPYAEKAGRLGWPVREITADHEALATAPHLLASVILELTGHDHAATPGPPASEPARTDRVPG